MMIIQGLPISLILIVLSSVQINASRYRSIRQTAANLCANPNNNTCLFITCENGGECVEDPTTADCFKCNCPVGFTGKVCDIPAVILPVGCDPGCQNGGVCNGNVCNCPVGYTGVICQTRDFCLPNNPCQNGGRCTSNGASYACDCSNTGYTGTICTERVPIDPCASRPCQNGGQCSSNGVTFNCLCTNGYTGTFCQIAPPSTTCNPNPCGAHGTCLQATLPTGPIVFCQCENRWTGKYCDVNMEENCPVGFCQSGGTCRMNGNTSYCICPPTHIGQQCEILIGVTPTITTTSTTSSPLTPIFGHCSSKPCLNGGSCFNTGNRFICICTSQYTGPTCAVAGFLTTRPSTTSTSGITCARQPCQNGGSCYNVGSSYYCYCGIGNYTGKNCETIVSQSLFDYSST